LKRLSTTHPDVTEVCTDNLANLLKEKDATEEKLIDNNITMNSKKHYTSKKEKYLYSFSELVLDIGIYDQQMLMYRTENFTNMVSLSLRGGQSTKILVR
jgi:hypothetical protein